MAVISVLLHFLQNLSSAAEKDSPKQWLTGSEGLRHLDSLGRSRLPCRSEKEEAAPGVWAGGAGSVCCRVRVAGSDQARKAWGWLWQQEAGTSMGLQCFRSWPSSQTGG